MENSITPRAIFVGESWQLPVYYDADAMGKATSSTDANDEPFTSAMYLDMMEAFKRDIDAARKSKLPVADAALVAKMGTKKLEE